MDKFSVNVCMYVFVGVEVKYDGKLKGLCKKFFYHH